MSEYTFTGYLVNTCNVSITKMHALTRIFVSLYKCGNTVVRRSRTRVGLLCAAELNATKATRRTFKSVSCNASKKSPIADLNIGSIACGCVKKSICRVVVETWDKHDHDRI